MAETNDTRFRAAGPASPSMRRARRRFRRILAKYPPGKQASAVIPLLYLVQNQMKRQTGSAWVPTAGDGRGGAALGYGADPRL